MHASQWKHAGQFGGDREWDGNKIYDNLNFDTFSLLYTLDCVYIVK